MRKGLLYNFGIVMIAALSLGGMTACSSKPAAPETSAAETTAAGQEEDKNSIEETVPEDGIILPDYKFTKENFPRMDGSTATVPLAEALAARLLGVEKNEAAELCQFNRTTQSFRNLMAGEADMLIVSEPQAKVYDEMEEAGFRYKMEPIATDALIFVVNADNPVEELTTEQIRDIYTGKITNWKEVGGNDADIIPFQRNEGAGSQALMVKLVMGDTPMLEAPQELVPTSMGDLMTAVKSYDNSANAIGYSVYYYANDMMMAKGLKIIAVDGVQPEAETIRSRKYPHLNPYFCVIPEECKSEGAKVIYDWIASENGQKLVNAEGYVSVMDVGTTGRSGNVRQANYTRLDYAPVGALTEIKAREDYERLYPYNGNEICGGYYDEENGDGIGYVDGYMMGFFDQNRRLVTDPVYHNIEMLEYYERNSGTSHFLPFYVAVKYESDSVTEDTGDVPDDKVHKQLVSLDGSFVSPEYAYISGMAGHAVGVKAWNADDFTVYDTDGNIVLTLDMLKRANKDFTIERHEYGSYSSIDYGEGYYVIDLKDGSYFVDEKTHKICYGPFDYASPFKNGKAFIFTYGKNYTEKDYVRCIDRDGNDLIPPDRYTSAQELPNGNILVGDGENSVVIELHTKVKRDLGKIGYSSVTKWGFSASPELEDGSYGSLAFDEKGQELFVDYEGSYQINERLPIVSIQGDPSDAVTPDTEGRGMWIYNFKTGKSLFVKGADSVYSFYTFEGVADLPYIQCLSYPEEGPDHFWIINEDLEILMEGDGYPNAIQDQISNKWYINIVDYASDTTETYDADLKRIGSYHSGVKFFDGNAVYVDKHAAVAEDTAGNEFFCYPMTGSLGND